MCLKPLLHLNRFYLFTVSSNGKFSVNLFLFLIMKLLPDQSVVYEYFSGSSVAVWKQWHNVLVHSIPCPNWPKTGHKYMYCLTLTEHIVFFISSDRLVSQFGKRRPLMLGGTVLLWWVVWSLLDFWFSLWTEHVFICKPLNWQQIYCSIMYVKSIKSGVSYVGWNVLFIWKFAFNLGWR